MRYVFVWFTTRLFSSNTVLQFKGTEAKAILDESTQKAVNSGGFGLPWFDCINAQGAKESFWGIDHLGRLVDFMQLDANLDDSFRVLL